MLLQDLTSTSHVKFGTSGARGLAADMTDYVCYAYTTAFLQYLEETGQAQEIHIQEHIFDAQGMLRKPFELPSANDRAADHYVRRYTDFFGSSCLAGLNIGLYAHSAVGRDPVCQVFAGRCRGSVGSKRLAQSLPGLTFFCLTGGGIKLGT